MESCMISKVYFYIYIYLIIYFSNHINNYSGVDAFSFSDITNGLRKAGEIVGQGLGKSGEFVKDKVICRPECCNDKYIHLNETGLQKELLELLHGQHLVADTVVKSLRGHFSSENPSKALVLSFHGTVGTGKNFVSKIIANNIYKQGMESSYVHLFLATHHFAHEERVDLYKEQLRSWITSNVSLCDRTMFIFDEMDKMPLGLIDTIKSYIDHYENIDKINYRKSIFLFLSNAGGMDIAETTLEHWKYSKPREQLTLKDFEHDLALGSYNENSGLWHSRLIENNLISHFIPFLPLERFHVKKCIADDMIKKGHKPTEAEVNKVADMLQFQPDDLQLYSKTGCKRVSQKVDLVVSKVAKKEEL